MQEIGKSYKHVRLCNHGCESGDLWINSGTGYIVGEEGCAAFNERIDLEFDSDGDTCCECGECTDHAVEINGSYYCRSCAEEGFTRCDDCGEWVDRDNSYYICDRDICESCLDNYTRCDHCDEYVCNDDATYIDGNNWCDCCRDDHFTKCDHCGEWVDNDEGTFVNDCAVCDDCLTSYYGQCADCGEWVHNDDCVCIDDETYCEDCADRLPVCDKCGCKHKDVTSVGAGESVCDDCLADHYDYDESIGIYVSKGQLCLSFA